MAEHIFPEPTFPRPTATTDTTTTPGSPNINIFKQNNVRIFGYNDKYVLVNSGDMAFMIFQRFDNVVTDSLLPSIVHIKCSVFVSIDKLPNAKQVPISSISTANMQIMIQCYMQEYPHKDKAKVLKKKYHISSEFAQYVVKVSKGSEERIAIICTDIVEARYYLKNNAIKADMRSGLQEGSISEKLDILSQLLSKETFDWLNTYKLGKKMLDMLIFEILD